MGSTQRSSKRLNTSLHTSAVAPKKNDHLLVPAPALQPQLLESGLLPPTGWLKALGCLAAFFPPCGVVLGVLYASQPHLPAKRFGTLCLWLALIGGLLMCCYWGLAGIWRMLFSSGSHAVIDSYF